MQFFTRQKYTYPHNLGPVLITFFVNYFIFSYLYLLKKVNQQKLWGNVGDPATSCRMVPPRIIKRVTLGIPPLAIKRITLGVPPQSGGMVVGPEVRSP